MALQRRPREIDLLEPGHGTLQVLKHTTVVKVQPRELEASQLQGPTLNGL